MSHARTYVMSVRGWSSEGVKAQVLLLLLLLLCTVPQYMYIILLFTTTQFTSMTLPYCLSLRLGG
jgi:hypothetical protein